MKNHLTMFVFLIVASGAHRILMLARNYSTSLRKKILDIGISIPISILFIAELRLTCRIDIYYCQS